MTRTLAPRALTLTVLAVLLLPLAAQAQSSRANRGDSTLMFGVSSGGHLPSVVAPPVGVGLFLGESLLVGAEYGSASYADETDDVEYTTDYTNAGGFARWFPGNSFNVLLAYHQRTWDAELEYTVEDESTGDEKPVDATLTAEAAVVTAGIGNQWTTDFGMVIGVDWLLGSALASSSRSGDIDDDTLETLAPGEVEEAEAELEDAGDLLNRASASPGVFVITLGWAF